VSNMTPEFEQLYKVLSEKGVYDLEKITRAYLLAEKAHAGQKRISGEAYIVHPISVATIVADLMLDTDSICAALLHDTVEDSGGIVDLNVIKKEFGQEVADLVDGVTKLIHIPFETKQDESIENLRKMFLAMSKDIRVIFIKLADRLHNMRTLCYRDENKQRSIALETMHVYAPLAHRLGIQKIKQELETLALQYLDPIAFEEIRQLIQKRIAENEGFLARANEMVAEALKEQGINFRLESRIKSIYSIYRKMYNQNKAFDEIYDFYAIRIIVKTEMECYTSLGVIHEQFNSMPGRFKDYISTPKPNLYRSLHTTVIGHDGIPFEVQIRTEEMHEIAEYGLAAHWKYKSGDQTKKDADEKYKWLRTLLETEKDLVDADEFLRPLKIDMFDDETFVFTPKGDVVSLPAGSNTIDFAYAIHSAVGNKMVGAKVNGKIVPIDYVLENGQIVEIITSSASKGPSRDWLKLVRSAEARNKIKQFFKKEMRSENIIIGKYEVDKELRRYGRPFTEAQKEEIVKNVAERMSMADTEDLYNNIGYGGLSVSKIASKLRDEFERVVNPITPEDTLQKAQEVQKKLERKTVIPKAQSVIIDSVKGCAVKFAKCCNPLPGDAIIGFITKGFGISIHKYDCENVVAGLKRPEDKDRWVVASWAESVEKQQFGDFEASLNIYASYSQKLIADVTLALSDMKVAIVSIKARENGDDMILQVVLKCSNIEHLKNIIKNMKKLSGVRDVARGKA
jgi:guanosine-3',5'-bis(diphosphate) 3'-pyrophosphohydrolase